MTSKVPTLPSYVLPVPGFPEYTFSYGGTLRRVTGGHGAKVGRVIKTHRVGRQDVYHLRGPASKLVFLSKSQLRELTFGTDEEFNKYSRGEESYQAKLTEANVIEIKRLAKTGMGSRGITKFLNLPVCHSTVQCILKGQNWRHTEAL